MRGSTACNLIRCALCYVQGRETDLQATRTIMISRLTLLFVLLCVTFGARAADETVTAFDFEFVSIEGEPLTMSEFAGRVVLVVNTASRCGFTHQYSELQAVWDRYREGGFVLLGIPSNDFGGQEPGTEAEIKDFCEVNFSIDFPMTSKVHVRGDDAHPFYAWAAEELGAASVPRWNFHKYLIGRDGNLAGWFSTPTRPTSDAIMSAIERELGTAHGS